jgi:hypothetical protein
MLKASKKLKNLADRINKINDEHPTGHVLLCQLWGVHYKLTKHQKKQMNFENFCNQFYNDLINQ